MALDRPGYCTTLLKQESWAKEEQSKGLEDMRHVQLHYLHMIKMVLDEGKCPKYYNDEKQCNGCITPNRW